MSVKNTKNIYLESFSFKEELDGVIQLDIQDVHLDQLNLFIGNNAQGKSRLFRTLQFIKDLLTINRKKIGTNFSASFNFRIGNDNVIYSIQIIPGNETNNYIEKITKNKKVLLSTNDKTLYDEESESTIKNFFIPLNTPALASINEPRFITINTIREYFLRMLFVDSRKVNEVVIEQAPLILNSQGTNLAGVLYNWSKTYPNIYSETLDDFKRCFPIIKDLKFVKGFIPQLGVKTELLAISEVGINVDINQMEWSDGLWRALCILCLPKTPFKFESDVYPPSLICIDEIENGLDFNTLEFITDYLKDYSDYIQIVMSSHSPLLGKFIHPKNWHIVKRKGPKIQVSKPQIIEPDLDKKLELYRQEYWDFYTNHISRSDSYEPK